MSERKSTRLARGRLYRAAHGRDGSSVCAVCIARRALKEARKR